MSKQVKKNCQKFQSELIQGYDMKFGKSVPYSALVFHQQQTVKRCFKVSAFIDESENGRWSLVLGSEILIQRWTVSFFITT